MVIFITKKKYISTFDETLSYLYYLMDIVSSTLNYRRSYYNYLGISLHILRRKYPLKAILKSKSSSRTSVILHNRTGVISLSGLKNHKEITYDMDTDIWTIPFQYKKEARNDRQTVKLCGGRDNGEVIPIFVNDIYLSLPVKGKTVIDVGANIADSSIYFALHGAERVIGIEPLPKNFEIAKKNIEINNLSHKINLILAGCAQRPGSIAIDANYQEIGACIIIDTSNTDNSNQSINVPLLTIENILEQNRVSAEDIVLKMDCEGCEYDVILSTSNEVLRLFSHILIEYHYGYTSLKQKLESCGFKLSITKPLAHKRDYLYEFPEDEWMYTGRIYAQRKC